MTPAVEDVIWRWRRAAVATVLLALAFVQDVGAIVPDTKLDLVVDPGSFLARALSVWDDIGFAGQLQNQAYGYLQPMGPFFWLGGQVLEPWVVQRLWWGLVLVTAFLGTARLARGLGIGSPAAQVVAALAYALSPRVVSVLGPVSAEAWPMALAPWVLVPLVAVFRRDRSPVRGGLEAALPVLLMGGVNAALNVAAILPAITWLLTRPWSRRARMTWLASGIAGVVATAWWVVPLLILGRYSPPFLDYIESASTTTLVTSLADSLRGTTQWVAYLPAELGGTWRAGHDLVVRPPLILYTMLAAGAGLAGLALSGLRERRWLVLTLAVSLVVLVTGHAATFGSPVDGFVRDLLDGPLAPLRNVHKFDVGVRLPLALGLAHLLTRGPMLLRRVASGRRLALGLVGAVLLSVGLGGAVPFLGDRIAPLGSFDAVPGYWAQAGRWLEEHPDGRTLLAPASRSGSYTWGLPGDEPIQALTSAPWDVRNAVPLTPAGHVRFLDAVSEAWETGAAVPGLAGLLSRSGVGYVLVRHDLDTERAGAPRPELVDAVLGASPGFTRVAGFGPLVGRPDPALGVPLRDDAVADAQVIDVWRVDPVPAAATAADLADVVELAGGPEGLLAAEASGLVAGTPTVLSVHTTPELARGRVVLTDSLARREVDVGRSRNDRSAILAADEDGVLGKAAREWSLSDDTTEQTTATWLGASGVTASSSASDLGATEPAQRWHSLAQAFDDDDSTAWFPASRDTRPTITVRYPTAVEPGRVTVRLTPAVLGAPAGPPTVRVGDDSGATDVRVVDDRVVVDIGGPTTMLTLGLPVGVGVTGVEVARAPVVAARRTPAIDVTNRANAVVLRTDPGRRDGCLGPFERISCDPAYVGLSEEGAGLTRLLPVTGTDHYVPALTVRPVGGLVLDERISQAAGLAVRATASSSGVSAPGGSALAAVDGLGTTTWTAAADDEAPSLTLSWSQPAEVDRVVLRTAAGVRASRPTTVRVQVGDTDVIRAVARTGSVEVPATRATSVRVTVLESSGRLGFDPVTGRQQRLPVGVTEARVPGVTTGGVRGDDVARWECGEGPTVRVGDQRLSTAVDARAADLYTGAEVPARVCDDAPVTLAGDTVVEVHRTDDLGPVRLSLVGSTWTAAPAAATADVVGGGTAVRLAVPPAGSDRLVARPLNENRGWVPDAPDVAPVTVDGWQQGYVVPSSRSEIAIGFAPASLYRVALLAGLAAAAILALAALWSLRRPDRAQLPAPAGRALPRALVWAGVAVLGGLLGGLAGLATVVVAAVVVGLLARREALDQRATLVGALLVAAALLMTAGPWGSARHETLAPPVQLLVLAGLVLAVAPLPRRAP